MKNKLSKKKTKHCLEAEKDRMLLAYMCRVQHTWINHEEHVTAGLLGGTEGSQHRWVETIASSRGSLELKFGASNQTTLCTKSNANKTTMSMWVKYDLTVPKLNNVWSSMCMLKWCSQPWKIVGARMAVKYVPAYITSLQHHANVLDLFSCTIF